MEQKNIQKKSARLILKAVGSACVAAARRDDPSLQGRIPLYFKMKETPFEGAGYKKATVTVENESQVKKSLGGDPAGSKLVECVKKALGRIRFDPSAPDDSYSFIIRRK